eukprot:169174-Pleurochrysis_carterae.AAC.1
MAPKRTQFGLHRRGSSLDGNEEEAVWMAPKRKQFGLHSRCALALPSMCCERAYSSFSEHAARKAAHGEWKEKELLARADGRCRVRVDARPRLWVLADVRKCQRSQWPLDADDRRRLVLP